MREMTFFSLQPSKFGWHGSFSFHILSSLGRLHQALPAYNFLEATRLSIFQYEVGVAALCVHHNCCRSVTCWSLNQGVLFLREAIWRIHGPESNPVMALFQTIVLDFVGSSSKSLVPELACQGSASLESPGFRELCERFFCKRALFGLFFP